MAAAATVLASQLVDRLGQRRARRSARRGRRPLRQAGRDRGGVAADWSRARARPRRSLSCRWASCPAWPPASSPPLGLVSALLYDWPLKSTPVSVLPYAVSFACLPAFVVLGAGRPRRCGCSPPVACSAPGAHFVNTLPDLDDDARTGVRGLPHLHRPARVARSPRPCCCWPPPRCWLRAAGAAAAGCSGRPRGGLVVLSIGGVRMRRDPVVPRPVPAVIVVALIDVVFLLVSGLIWTDGACVRVRVIGRSRHLGCSPAAYGIPRWRTQGDAHSGARRRSVLGAALLASAAPGVGLLCRRAAPGRSRRPTRRSPRCPGVNANSADGQIALRNGRRAYADGVQAGQRRAAGRAAVQQQRQTAGEADRRDGRDGRQRGAGGRRRPPRPAPPAAPRPRRRLFLLPLRGLRLSPSASASNPPSPTPAAVGLVEDQRGDPGRRVRGAEPEHQDATSRSRSSPARSCRAGAALADVTFTFTYADGSTTTHRAARAADDGAR